MCVEMLQFGAEPFENMEKTPKRGGLYDFPKIEMTEIWP